MAGDQQFGDGFFPEGFFPEGFFPEGFFPELPRTLSRYEQIAVALLSQQWHLRTTGAPATIAARFMDRIAGQTGGLEARAATLFRVGGGASMFGEEITYHVNGGSDRTIYAVFQPTPPTTFDHGGREVEYEAMLRISYDASLGVEQPQAFHDRVTIRGETWQVLPAPQKTGGHWALPLRRQHRGELTGGRVRRER